MREGFTLAALFGSAAITALLLATPPEAHAAPLCEHRSAAHIAEHGGQAEDSRWHIARGELPNCDEEQQKASEHHDTDKASSGDGSEPNKDNDDKSRYCRKRWFC